MSSSDTAYLDDLVARRTDVDCGSCRIVTIPEFDNLSKSQQTAVFRKLEQLDNVASVDASELHARLNLLISTPDLSISRPKLPPSSLSTTEPCDPEEKKEEDRLIENEARQTLESEGCPPCCSADPSLFAPDPADEDRKDIMSYWETSPLYAGGVVYNQWMDWRKFRNFQQRVRQKYLHRHPFTDFIDIVKERRRRHNLEVDVHLHIDPKQQSRIETWLEFQNYHLHLHEHFERDVHTEEEGLETERKKLYDPDESVAALAAGNCEIMKIRIASAQEKVREHGDILLPWIEQQRLLLVAGTSTKTGSYEDEKPVQIDAVRDSPAPNRRKRRTAGRSVFDPVPSGVSKPPPQRRSLRLQRLKVSQQIENVLPAPGFPPHVVPQNSQTSHSPRKSRSSPYKHQSAKENAYLTPFRPSKVTKFRKDGVKKELLANKKRRLWPIDVSGRTKPCKSVQEMEPVYKKPLLQIHQSYSKTRSGRECRKPKRYGFLSSG